jgi:hypothetical protein
MARLQILAGLHELVNNFLGGMSYHSWTLKIQNIDLAAASMQELLRRAAAGMRSLFCLLNAVY